MFSYLLRCKTQADCQGTIRQRGGTERLMSTQPTLPSNKRMPPRSWIRKSSWCSGLILQWYFIQWISKIKLLSRSDILTISNYDLNIIFKSFTDITMYIRVICRQLNLRSFIQLSKNVSELKPWSNMIEML